VLSNAFSAVYGSAFQVRSFWRHRKSKGKVWTENSGILGNVIASCGRETKKSCSL
jgi:uncharacterized membrane protein HdeD (DUF308 family)